MKTTLDIPEQLLQDAQKSSGQPTKTATIVLALEQLIRLSRLAELRARRGSMPSFSIDLDVTRGRS